MSRVKFISKKKLAERWGCTERSIDRYRADPNFPKAIMLGPQLLRFDIDEIISYEARANVQPVTRGQRAKSKKQKLLAPGTDWRALTVLDAAESNLFATTRAKNALLDSVHDKTLGELATWSRMDFIRLPNFGAKSYRELQEMFEFLDKSNG